MTIATVRTLLQEAMRQLTLLEQTSHGPAAAALPPLPRPTPPPSNTTANWMSSYQADCLIWATAIQHGVVVQHPDANAYRNDPNYVWPDKQKALAGQGGTPTRPGGNTDNNPRGI